MIKIKDIVEKFGDYEVDEDKLKEILIKPKPKSIWDLDDCDDCYIIYGNGNIDTAKWFNPGIHYARYNRAFLTEEEALFERERRFIEAEMLRLGGTRDMLSMKSKRTYRYLINYDSDIKRLYTDWCQYTITQWAIYFKFEKDAENAIKKIGEDRIKKYIFNVKEGK